MRAQAVVLVALAVLLSACGTPAHSGQAGPAPAVTTARPPDSSGPAACAQGAVTVTEADNGKTVCVVRGTRIAVLLRATTSSRWAPVAGEGTVLTRAAAGRGSLPVGVTGAFYTASRAGEEQLDSSRAACPSATPGTVRCGAVIAYTVTIDVR